MDLPIELAVLIAAFLLDLAFAEPPLAIHPTVWFGKIVGFFDKIELKGKISNFLLGVVCVLSCVTFAIFLAFLPIPYPFNLFWQTYLLFSSFSIKSMIKHAENCVKSNMDPSKVQMIVSRDTRKLTFSQRCSAVIESTSENFVDGVFSPLFYFAIFGVPGAIIFRAVNTCDAMIGYRVGKYEYFGKFAARLDDLLNYIPARLSLLFFELFKRGSFVYGLKRKVKLNGTTIAAMSYLLGVKLEKPGYYSLPGREPNLDDVKRAVKFFMKISFLTIIFTALLLILRSTLTS